MMRDASLRVPVKHPAVGIYSAHTQVTIVHQDAHGYTICLDNSHPRGGLCHCVVVQRDQLHIPHERKGAA